MQSEGVAWIHAKAKGICRISPLIDLRALFCLMSDPWFVQLSSMSAARASSVPSSVCGKRFPYTSIVITIEA